MNSLRKRLRSIHSFCRFLPFPSNSSDTQASSAHLAERVRSTRALQWQSSMADQQLVLSSPVSAHLWLNYCNSKDDQQRQPPSSIMAEADAALSALQTNQSAAITATLPIEASPVAAAISTDSAQATASVEFPVSPPAASSFDTNGNAVESSSESVTGAISRQQLFSALGAAERESALAARESEEV